MALIEVLVLIGTLFIGVYGYAQYSYGYWKRKGVPHDEAIFPFGSLKGITKTANLAMILKNKYFESKGLQYYGLSFFVRPALLVRDPVMIKEILVKKFSTFHDRGFHLNSDREPLTGHLFFLRGQSWRNMRIQLTPTFTSGKMKNMFSTMAQSGEEMIEFLENGAAHEEVVEVKDMFAKFTTNIIARCAFGMELDSFKNPNAEFRNVSQFLFKPGLIQAIITATMFAFSKFLYYGPLRIIPKKQSDFFIGAVSETMKYREENNVKRNDFLQMLIELKKKGKIEDSEIYSHGEAIAPENPSEDLKKFTVNKAAAQAFAFFVAGFETASTTLQFCLFELSLNTDLQGKLRKEVDQVMKKHNGKLSYEAIQEMSYMDQIISETLRKYPPAPFILRETTENFTLPNGQIVDKGTRVMVSLFGLHQDPEFFPNPEKFDPERFSPENKEKIVPFSYLPFGEGPRICIGMRFGLLQVKIGLALFIHKYKAQICDQTPLPPVKLDPKAFLLGIKEGMYLRISKRD